MPIAPMPWFNPGKNYIDSPNPASLGIRQPQLLSAAWVYISESFHQFSGSTEEPYRAAPCICHAYFR